jgi:peptidyl-prolyl cis-trans isomerase B (cyclophilin B)
MLKKISNAVDGGIEPGVQRSGTPGKQSTIEDNPRSGRRLCDLVLAADHRSTINDRFQISHRPLRGLATIFRRRSWGLRPRLYANVRSADCFLSRLRQLRVTVFLLVVAVGIEPSVPAQNPPPNSETPKKANTRPAGTATVKAEPFDGASIEKMTGQCVTLETEQGEIVIEVLPGKAPESARNFLNLAVTGALDTTSFERVVPGFVIQGGDLSTSERWNAQLANRAQKRLVDEPSDLRHVRGVVSMARTDQPNSATTHFFILVGDGPHLDGSFSAFGRVRRGMEVADAINRAPSQNEKPSVPVRITRAEVATCGK